MTYQLYPRVAGLPRYSAPLLACLAMAACSQPSATQDNAANAHDAAAATANAAATVPAVSPGEPADTATGNTVGGDGSEIVLTGLSGPDIDGAKLSGELACSFTASGTTTDRAVLLLARGNVGSKDAALGVVKVMDYVERIGAPGGYDGMLRGATFAGQGKTVRIALTGAAPSGGGESPPRAATLTYLRGDGASRVFPGAWTCGP